MSSLDCPFHLGELPGGKVSIVDLIRWRVPEGLHEPHLELCPWGHFQRDSTQGVGRHTPNVGLSAPKHRVLPVDSFPVSWSVEM